MVSKLKKFFSCSKCDAQFPKWMGQCSECGNWGTLQEEEVKSEPVNQRTKNLGEAGEIISFEKINAEEYPRIETKINELDRVLGGGLVLGSVILLSGEPGIGKSTLVLQIANQLITNNQSKILYVSGEESVEQIKMRIDRLKIKTANLEFLGETNIENIVATIEKEKPNFVIIDSIQTMSSSETNSEAGSIAQVRVSTSKLLTVAKKEKIPILIIAHITKEGTIAGPKTMEHLVDTVCYFEGDPYHQFRLLRVSKNRFGNTSEVGVFEMTDTGLREVKNPSEAFLSHKEKVAGSAIAAILAGGRSFLVEVQALVARTSFGYPQRRVVAVDFNRAQLLIAVLSRRLGLPLGSFDIHLNITGGIRVEEPALDLAIVLAIVSAYKDKPIDKDIAIFGEVGLGGEIRRVGQEEKRISEAKKLGFRKIIKPASNFKNQDKDLKIIEVKTIKEAVDEVFQ